MPRHARHKKGAMPVFEAVMWIVRGLILIYILLSIKFITGAFIVKNIDTRLADSYVFMNALYYSKEGLAAQDTTTGRIYPGTLPETIPKEISEAYGFGEKGPMLAAKITISDSEAFYDEKNFKDWNILHTAGLTEGIGGVRKFGMQRKMIGDGMTDAKIEVVMKNG